MTHILYYHYVGLLLNQIWQLIYTKFYFKFTASVCSMDACSQNSVHLKLFDVIFRKPNHIIVNYSILPFSLYQTLWASVDSIVLMNTMQTHTSHNMNHVSTSWLFLSLLYHNLQTIYTNIVKSVTTAEFNELSSEIYGSAIPHSELKILAKIYLGVICTHMVDYCRPGHICTYSRYKHKALIHSIG